MSEEKGYENDGGMRGQEAFAAVNSGSGFISYYEKIFSDPRIVRRYLLVGGPGTGKSSFMRRVAQAAEQRGLKVEYYRCSSDYTSLDAIVIEKSIALLDATAPHTVEPELAGAKDEIVNLGQFWDSRKLFEKRDIITSLLNEKSKSYSGAYRFLSGAMALEMRAREVSEGFIKSSKLDKAVGRTIEKIACGAKYSCGVAIRSSIGMRGRATLEYYEQRASKLYLIDDYMGTAHAFLERLAQRAIENGNAVVVSFEPLCAKYIDGILFEDSGEGFVVCTGDSEEKYTEKIAGKINMRRFVRASGLCDDEKRKKSEYRNDIRLREGLVDSACGCLREAGGAHFELERIYGECMDFDAESRFCRSFAEDICNTIAYLAK